MSDSITEMQAEIDKLHRMNNIIQLWNIGYSKAVDDAIANGTNRLELEFKFKEKDRELHLEVYPMVKKAIEESGCTCSVQADAKAIKLYVTAVSQYKPSSPSVSTQ